MERLLADLRGLRAATGIRQKVIADQMGLTELRLSQILNGRAPVPEQFEERFRSAVATLAEEAAAQERAEAETRARAMLEAAGVREKAEAA